MTSPFENVSHTVYVDVGKTETFCIAMGIKAFERLPDQYLVNQLKDSFTKILEEPDTDYVSYEKPTVVVARTSLPFVLTSNFQNQIVDTTGGYFIIVQNIKEFYPNIRQRLNYEDILDEYINKGCAVLRNRGSVEENLFYKNQEAWGLDLLPLEKFSIKIINNIGLSITYMPEHVFDAGLVTNANRFKREAKEMSNLVIGLDHLVTPAFDHIKHLYSKKKDANLSLIDKMRAEKKPIVLKGTRNILFGVWVTPQIHKEISLFTLYDSRVLAVLKRNLSTEEQATISLVYNQLIALRDTETNPNPSTEMPPEWNKYKHVKSIITQKNTIVDYIKYITGFVIEFTPDAINDLCDAYENFEQMPEYRVTQMSKLSDVMEKLKICK